MRARKLFLDTETTSIDAQGEIIELAVLDADGGVQMDVLIRPRTGVTEGARAIHGITDAMLVDCPAWPEVVEELRSLLSGREVVSHNAHFDRRMLNQTCDLNHTSRIEVVQWECTMLQLTDENNGKWPSLDRAMQLIGVMKPHGIGHPHRALYDAECCRLIYNKIYAKSEIYGV